MLAAFNLPLACDKESYRQKRLFIKKEPLWLPKSRTGNTLECQSHCLLEWSLQQAL
jgi:hypothetical protein